VELENSSMRADGVVQRGSPIDIDVDGAPVQAFEGETIAAALIAAGHKVLRYTASGRPRGVFCAMGACFDCVVEVDGDPSVRSCVTPVRAGMRIRTPGAARGE
jgi:predicted molibdopterin-dependent oxidoreductase YjgC